MKRSKFQINFKINLINIKVEMRAQIIVDGVPISITLVPNLLHHNNVGVTYARISKFKMEQ
jgi:hypothetical protein